MFEHWVAFQVLYRGHTKLVKSAERDDEEAKHT